MGLRSTTVLGSETMQSDRQKTIDEKL